MLLKIVNWFYKWLPIIFGCHCRDDRSFYWNGKKFPICARCTGILVGSLTAFMTYILICCPISVCVFLIIPLVMDGFGQQLTAYSYVAFTGGCEYMGEKVDNQLLFSLHKAGDSDPA